MFTMNLNWNENPKPTDILKVLASIPETLTMDEMYTCPSEEKIQYAFRGMIVYQGAHYFAFFRRMLIKLDF